MSYIESLGAIYRGDNLCSFRVWAPAAKEVKVHILEPKERLVALQRENRGYHHAVIEDVEPGSLYLYRLDGKVERPDPASRYQPRGVHEASQVIDTDFTWEDHYWHGLPLHDYIIYELHVGTYTTEGTFTTIIPHLDRLKELGITAIEIMPVAQFPGSRNWGYDGVYPFAVQSSYGGPDALRVLINACHKRGLAVVLDVVYNHLGPEGNYLPSFGPYFTDRYHTPWGKALNFDGPHSDEVRRFFIENAVYWTTGFHIDALRLDAVHAIMDSSPYLFIEELTRAVHENAMMLNRSIHVIAESDANDSRIVRPSDRGGYGLDALWNDDFHHSLHTLLTGEQVGYYEDFGTIQHIKKAFREGFVYSGEYSLYRQRRQGTSSRSTPADSLIVFAQNHDQTGNRMLGDRLIQLVSFEAVKLAAGVVILSPFIPLLFMGEEYGELAPFQYFISHSDIKLVEAVRRGRREEFSSFKWQGELPDPYDEQTFLHATLNHHLRNGGNHKIIYDFYKKLIQLRKERPSLSCLSKQKMEVQGYEKEKALLVRRWNDSEEVLVLYHFGSTPVSLELSPSTGHWNKVIDSTDKQWNGPGSKVPAMLDSEVFLALEPHSFMLFMKKTAEKDVQDTCYRGSEDVPQL
jgi:maltooligosyltrehalose trehalohydrolase